MVTPQSLDSLLERLRALTHRRVGEAGQALSSERLAFASCPDGEAAVALATEHAVAFANHRGGDLILGIGADGRIEGCPTLDPLWLAHEVFTRTRPSIVVQCWGHSTVEGLLTVVSVTEEDDVRATADGRRIRRLGRANVPITPDQDNELLGSRLEADFTNRPLPSLQLQDLDPVQLLYLREIIRRKNDQSELLELTDDELLQSLGLVNEEKIPRVAALLLLGRRKVLREVLPQAEVVYIHLDAHDEPDAQEQLYLPLLHTLSRVQDLIEARNRFTTLRQGMFHFQVKDFDEEVYREALVNALVHRDYRRRDGSIHIAHYPDRLEIANPGGFIGGVASDNILYHPPRHRNRRLTEVLQQLGLMERAGAGVNRLYRFLLRKGKPVPEYEATPESIRLTLYCGGLDEAFARFIAEEESKGRLFSLDMLIVLSSLKQTKELERSEAARLAQRPDRSMSQTLSNMVEWGYLERAGAGRAVTYRLTGQVYERFDAQVAYFRDRGLSQRRQRSLLLEVAEELGGLTQAQGQELCGLTELEATRLFRELVRDGLLTLEQGRYCVSRASREPLAT